MTTKREELERRFLAAVTDATEVINCTPEYTTSQWSPRLACERLAREVAAALADLDERKADKPAQDAGEAMDALTGVLEVWRKHDEQRPPVEYELVGWVPSIDVVDAARRDQRAAVEAACAPLREELAKLKLEQSEDYRFLTFVLAKVGHAKPCDAEQAVQYVGRALIEMYWQFGKHTKRIAELEAALARALNDYEHMMAQRNALQADLDAEQAGALELRKRHGARDDETFEAFVERIAGLEAAKAAPVLRCWVIEADFEKRTVTFELPAGHSIGPRIDIAVYERDGKPSLTAPPDSESVEKGGG